MPRIKDYISLFQPIKNVHCPANDKNILNKKFKISKKCGDRPMATAMGQRPTAAAVGHKHVTKYKLVIFQVEMIVY